VKIVLEFDLAQLPHQLGVARKIGLAFPQTRGNTFGDHVRLVAAKAVGSHGSDNLPNSIAASTRARNIPGYQPNIALTFVVKGYQVFVVIRWRVQMDGRSSVVARLTLGSLANAHFATRELPRS